MYLSSPVTHDALFKLKCSDCNNYLSYFPIYIFQKSRNLCGRCCNKFRIEKYARNEIYETLAQFVQFPCSYDKNGCVKELTPNDMPDHEKHCQFRRMECPLKPAVACDWEGEISTCKNHCEDKHCQLMIENGEFQLDLSQSSQNDNFIVQDSNLYVLHSKFYSINSLLEFSVYNPKYEFNPNEVPYEISFKTPNQTFIRQCKTSSFIDRKVTNIILSSMKDSLLTSIVHCKINFFNDDNSPVGSTIEEKIDENMLSLLKCTNCENYALPPIYENSNNIMQCYNCQGESVNLFKKTNCSLRNSAALDNIASSLNYPCKNSGCLFISKPFNMKSHYLLCPCGTYKCPVNEYTSCSWIGVGKDITYHIKEHHSNMIINSSKVLFLEISPLPHFPNSAPPKCYIVQFGNDFFRLDFGQIKDCYHWVVQKIGPIETEYMFELEIIDKKDQSRGLVIKQHCTYLKNKNYLFNNNKCYFSTDHIATFASDNSLMFKIQILKNK